MGLRLKKGDMVEIVAGKQKGKTGKILDVISDGKRVRIEKLNLVKRHSKPSQKKPQGGVVEKESPIHYSNVLLLCPKCNRGVRVSNKLLKDGTKVRTCRRCSEVIDKV